MAIAYARVEYPGRSDNGGNANACCKGAYNARSIIRDNRTGVTYDWEWKGGNVFHEMLLPNYVDHKFKDISEFANEVERSEKRKDSQLFEEWVLALPKEEEVTLEMKKELVLEFIKRKEWIEEGLGVQIDIHEPHEYSSKKALENEKLSDKELAEKELNENWHAHLLVTTRRFTKDGLGLEDKKAIDLKPEIKYGKVQKNGEIEHYNFWKNVQEDKFGEWGLDLKVDLPHAITQEHIGPVRMRSVMNAAVLRNEERMQANIENLSSGDDLLSYVSKYMSVFSESDLMGATKIIADKEQREALVADALKNQSLVALHEQDGKESGYYTTRDIRKEEEKILRLSGYVAQESNVLLKGSYKQMTTATAMLEEVKQSGQLTQEQYEALSHVLFTRSGVRVLRGRAGTGKSHVLGKLVSIAEAAGLSVIGLVPTHKARGELAARGYANNDTVKGMLFKHYNGKFELPKASLIVLDEAGMVGNDDYQELLRVVAANKCNIILAGDERQLSSVQRGGMFEVFDREYGSALIANIQRQKAQWGRDVAMAMSRGEIRSGVKVLHEQGKIIEHGDKQSSMQGLIEDWSKSDKRVEDRLIIAISNKDVAALNHGVRQYLKLSGKLTGDEIRVGAHYYQKGDKILITDTNKDLGLTNGDYAQVVEATADKFVITKGSNDSSGDRDSSSGSGSNKEAQEATRELIEFNPKDYGGFKHGYATTVFKAQGASISDVYVYHASYGWMRNSYVALSRCIDEMKLYVNKESTKSIDQLVRQLGNNTYESSSLIYQTKEDITAKEAKDQEDTANALNRGILGSVWKGFDKVAEVIGTRVVKWADKSQALDEYYKYEKLEVKQHIVEEVLNEVYEEVVAKEGYQVQKVDVGEVRVGGNIGKVRLFGSNNSNPVVHQNNTKSSIHGGAEVNKSVVDDKGLSSGSTKVALTPKEKFYANRVRLKQNEINKQQRKEEWNRDQERLRSEVRYKVEDIARDLLGPENKRLSQKNSLRWGEHGKLAMNIRGERAGIWCDFSSGKGGDIFDLVQDIRKSDFKAAVEYLEAAVGFKKTTSSNLRLVYDHNNSDILAKVLKQREEEARENKQKQEQVVKLYDRSKEIGNTSIAYRYLKDARRIDCQLGEDIRTAGIYVREQVGIETDGIHNIKANTTNQDKGKYYPALIVFARNKEGEITGGQQILLDKNSAKKADLAVVKKSFGKISGSFVHLSEEQNNRKPHMNDRSDRITIIAEGLETALSVKQSLVSEQVEHPDNTDKNMNILCSLGISNIRNYQPTQGEKIIIAADNDGENNITSKTIATAKEELEQRGAFVEIVMPSKEGDFNDVLKVDGEQAIRNSFARALRCHKAKTVEEFIANQTESKRYKLDDIEKADLELARKYNIPQDKQQIVVDAYRAGHLHGKLELEALCKNIGFAENHYEQNHELIGLGDEYYKTDKDRIIAGTIGKSELEFREHCIRNVLDQFNSQKKNAKSIDEVLTVIVKEQEYLGKIIKQDHLKDSNLINGLKKSIGSSVVHEFEKELIANSKQGILSQDQLKEIIGHNDTMRAIEILATHAKNNRDMNLKFSIADDTKFIEKLEAVDRDHLVGQLKDMDRNQKSEFMSNYLVKAIDNHILPQVEAIEQERQKANSFNELFASREKEYDLYSKFGEEHVLAFAKYGSIKRDYKLFEYTKELKHIDFKEFRERIDHLLTHGAITNERAHNDFKTYGCIGQLHKDYKIHEQHFKEAQMQKQIEEQQKMQASEHDSNKQKKLQLHLKIDM